MIDEPLHPLRQWRLDQGLTLDAAGAGVGTFRSTWYDWEIGRRIPDRTYMPKIYLFTRGEIDANSFHFPNGFPDLHQAALPFDGGDAPLFAVDRIAA